MEATDEELLRRWRAGDADAGDALVGRHFSSVYRFFRAKLDQEVEDLTQRTMLACLEGKERIQEGASVRAYLLGIARHMLFRHFRDKKKRGRLEDLMALSADDLRESPSRIVAVQEEHKLLLLGLRGIALDHQIAIELFYWEKLSVAEMAHVLGVEAGTVKSRLHRARQALRARIEAMDAGEELVRSTVGDLDKWANSLRGRLDADLQSGEG